MKTYTDWNLDDENEAREFVSTYLTRKNRQLANLLGIRGAGASRKANSLSNYAWNKCTAMDCRKSGDIQAALMYEGICQRIFEGMAPEIRW